MKRSFRQLRNFCCRMTEHKTCMHRSARGPTICISVNKLLEKCKVNDVAKIYKKTKGGEIEISRTRDTSRETLRHVAKLFQIRQNLLLKYFFPIDLGYRAHTPHTQRQNKIVNNATSHRRWYRVSIFAEKRNFPAETSRININRGNWLRAPNHSRIY